VTEQDEPSPEEFRRIRNEKRESMLEAGEQPYPYEFGRTDSAEEALESFDPEEGEELGEEVAVAGRITAMRSHGKATFLDLSDESGTIQIYLSAGYLEDEADYDTVQDHWDVGDFAGVHGELFETNEGEISVVARRVKMLSKGLRPLPEKFHGLQDVELRYRKRYLDLLSNPEVRDVFKVRSDFVFNIRKTLREREFREVETPMMQTIVGGAEAEPFETHHNALDLDLYLRIAPELFLKRLLVGGFEQVFEINRNFRNEGISTRHNPEFTMLELYHAYVDYHEIMELTEQFVSRAIEESVGELQRDFQDRTVDWSPPWNRRPMLELIEEHTGLQLSVDEAPDAIFDRAHDAGVEVEPKDSTGEQIMEVFEEAVEEELTDPTFVTEFPADICPLAKDHREKDGVAERFELFAGGLEIGNAYSELNDPVVQREILEDQAEHEDELDEDFLEALEYGMPPAGGLGLGIDRLTMLITDSDSIRDVILFPLMSPED
jgi:lysyl-tRNA synthetase class 2